MALCIFFFKNGLKFIVEYKKYCLEISPGSTTIKHLFSPEELQKYSLYLPMLIYFLNFCSNNEKKSHRELRLISLIKIPPSITTYFCLKILE